MEHINGWLERIERAADEASINIIQELDQAGRKMKYQWRKLHRIATEKLSQRSEIRAAHAEKILNHLLPDEMLQERHNSMMYFLALVGNRLLQTLEAEVDVFKPQHLIIDLEVD